MASLPLVFNPKKGVVVKNKCDNNNKNRWIGKKKKNWQKGRETVKI